MLTCNNCGHNNPVHATQCHHCRMDGNFNLPEIKGTETGPDMTEPQQVKNTCLNCGEAIAENDPKCAHCHFPAGKNTVPKAMPYQAALRIRRNSA